MFKTIGVALAGHGLNPELNIEVQPRCRKCCWPLRKKAAHLPEKSLANRRGDVTGHRVKGLGGASLTLL